MPNRIFVAYPYALPKDDYRGVFDEATQDFEIDFYFADELLTNRHVLEKIVALIDEARFSLFDITLWNPNVTLELGIAIGRRRPYFLLFDRSRRRTGVPSDLAGIDRVEYGSYTQLRAGLYELLDQQGVKRRTVPGHRRDDQALHDPLELQVVAYVSGMPGLNAYLVAKHFPETSPGRVRQILDDAVKDGLLRGSNVHGYRAAPRTPD